MKIFALSDLHLALATPSKSMAVFGPHWEDHASKIASNWRERVGANDIMLLAGDTSWAMHLDEALFDLEFINRLPGRKVLIKGNHDYWWSSAAKVRACLPEGMFIIQNDAIALDGAAFAGSRLWVDHEMPPLKLKGRRAEGALPSPAKEHVADEAQDEKIFLRELNRLELSLSRLDGEAELRVALVHYPPISSDLKSSRTTALLEAAGVHHCIFGHLHNLEPSPGRGVLGAKSGIVYHLTSCDYLDFLPTLIAEI